VAEPPSPWHLKDVPRGDHWSLFEKHATPYVRERYAELVGLQEQRPKTEPGPKPRLQKCDNTFAEGLGRLGQATLLVSGKDKFTKGYRLVEAKSYFADPKTTAEHCGFVKSPVTGMRTRGLFHTWQSNDTIEGLGYKCRTGRGTGLGDPSVIDDKANAPCGASLDFKMGYSQLSVTEAAKQFRRFKDEDDNIWELNVDAMGETVSAEQMSLVTAVVGHVPGYSRVVFDDKSHPGTFITPDVAVDGVRATGDPESVAAWLKASLQRAKDFNFTVGDVTEPSTKYTFYGRVFDHIANTVCLAEKAHTKLVDAPFYEDMKYDDFESAFGRLFNAASVLDDELSSPAKYRCLATARRLSSLRNACVILDHSPTKIDRQVLAELQAWHKELVHNVPRVVPLPGCKRRFILYTDATPFGRGGVLYDLLNNSVFSVAGKFDKILDINDAETRAVADSIVDLVKCGALPKDVRPGEVEVRIDNAAALAAVRRRRSRSERVNEAIHQFHKCGIPGMRAGRVASADNPSDAISRGKPLDWGLLVKALRDGGVWG
jgi:hypothetical protein